MGCEEPLYPESYVQPGNLGIHWKPLMWSSFSKPEEGWEISCLLKFFNNRIAAFPGRKRNEKLLILFHALLICSSGGDLHGLVQCLSIQSRVTSMAFLVGKLALMVSFLSSLIKHLKYSCASPETSQKSFILCYSLPILIWYSTSLSCSLDGHLITFSLVVSCRLLSHCHLVFMHTPPKNWILFPCF